MRFRSVQAGPLMQTPIFILLFLAPVYVPLHLLEGWIHGVARLNPITYLLVAGRSFVAGEAQDIALASGILVLLASGLALWGLRGLKRAEQIV
jgi:ABC-2 type transport system permease protein